MKSHNLNNWYTAAQAAMRLSKNSGRPIDPAYVRKLAQKGLIETLPMGARSTLYSKKVIDNYVVEERGAKLARAMQQKRESK